MRGEQLGSERSVPQKTLELLTAEELAERLRVPASWIREQTRIAEPSWRSTTSFKVGSVHPISVGELRTGRMVAAPLDPSARGTN
jgi:hypothetical protein